MTDKLWCQMCGKPADGSTSLLPGATCPSCGAVLVEVPAKDILQEQIQVRDTMINELIGVGNRLVNFAEYTGFSKAEYACIDWRLLLRKVEESRE